MADILIPLTTEASDLPGDSTEIRCYDNGVLEARTFSLDWLSITSQPNNKFEILAL